MLLVPAGAPVDAVINELVPLLKKGDLIIDAGNSHYTDTNLRAQNLAKGGIQFLGVGVSGGEEGARNGPSIMPGGPKEAYERVRPILEAISANINGDPCVAYLGNGSAGLFVKMVHNGIEYGIMQLISETNEWNKSELSGYLIEITSQIFDKQNATTGKRLIDEILDVARQKGTGMWTSQSAMELQVPTPTIDLAVAMRELSVLEQQRVAAEIGVPVSGFMTLLGHLDSYRCIWLPANLIQAQRDFFGSHSYERIDSKGTFHTQWEQNEQSIGTHTFCYFWRLCHFFAYFKSQSFCYSYKRSL